MPSDDLDLKIEQARRELLQIPGVVGVGYGYKERGGKVTQELTLRVYVREKKVRGALPPSQVVPGRLHDLPVDVVVPPIGQKLSCIITQGFSPLVGGAGITNLKRWDPVTGGPVTFGTLGFFATRNDSSSRDNIALLSNHHVLASDGAAAGDKVFQPKLTGTPPIIAAREDMHPIGKIHNIGFEDHRDYGYDGDTIVPLSYWIDAATSTVDTDFSSWCHTNCGVKYANAIHGLAVGAPASNKIEGIARIRNSDLPSGGDYVVYKIGRETGRTVGKVRDTLAPATDRTTGAPRNNVILIDNLGPNCENGTKFADEGDSGAVIVNSERRIIGILYAGDLSAGTGLACHIHPVVSLMNITMISTSHDPGASAESTLREISTTIDESDPLAARASVLRREILDSKQGTLYRNLFMKHRDEVVHLVNRVRPVTVAWHRLHGPDFMGHVLHASQHSNYSVPRELNGLRRDDAFARLIETLSRHGSVALRADIALHVDEVRRMLDQVDDIEALAAQLRERERVEVLS